MIKHNKNIINIIRNTGAIRKFKNISIQHRLIKKIVDAGIWAPSVLAFQPWEYILISDEKLIKSMASVCRNEAHKFPSIAERILLITSNVISESKFLIAVYNNRKLSNHIKKYGMKWVKYLNNAELLSIGASVQNMYLVANYLGLGAVWLDSPCLLETKINHMLDSKLKLVTLLAIGYPNMKSIRSKRKRTLSDFKFLK